MPNLKGHKKSWKNQSFLLDFFCPIESHFFGPLKNQFFSLKIQFFGGVKNIVIMFCFSFISIKCNP